MLKKAKAKSITMMIEDCNRDSKKLYNLAALLMGIVKENHLPDHMDKEELADWFASFFITKIQRIRYQLDSLPTYCHISSNPPEFLEFELMSEEEVGGIIRGMPAKMCDMDITLTTLLKDALPGLLPTIIIIIRFCLLSACWMLWISASLCSQHFLYILYSLSLTSPWYCPSILFLVFPFLFSHQFLLLITVFVAIWSSYKMYKVFTFPLFDDFH